MCFIPARGGSKGIPRKNLAEVGGQSLLEISIKKASGVIRELAGTSQIVVSTDDDEIADEALLQGASTIHRRPENLATDASTLEEALTHFVSFGPLPEEPSTVIAVLQCTSPFIKPTSIRSGIELVQDGVYDSVFTGVRNHFWLYEENGAGGSWRPKGHDLKTRPPRQSLPASAHETGGGYFFRLEGFIANGFRLHGRVGLVELDNLEAIDIDEPDDLENCRLIANGQASPERRLG